MSKRQKVPTLWKKHLTLSGGNFSLLAPKIDALFSKDKNLKDLSFYLEHFHEQFFVLTKRS